MDPSHPALPPDLGRVLRFPGMLEPGKLRARVVARQLAQLVVWAPKSTELRAAGWPRRKHNDRQPGWWRLFPPQLSALHCSHLVSGLLALFYDGRLRPRVA